MIRHAVGQAFAGYSGLADLTVRHASGAARAVTSRETLGEAVDRTKVGQAQGILMVRHQLAADQAFAILVRESQHTNTMLRTIAEGVILAGRLDGPGLGRPSIHWSRRRQGT